MRVMFIGCGYVADKYLRLLNNHPSLELAGLADRDLSRARLLADFYHTQAFSSVADALADSSVELVVNLTDPASHFAVTKASLLAGKHVYTEKPMALRYEAAEELVDLASARRLLLSSAPCSILGSSAQTAWSAVTSGVIGRIRLVYAELDDNPIDRMNPEMWTNRHGIRWPAKTERQMGCTLEHASYHLTWLCAMFGPAAEVDTFRAVIGSQPSDHVEDGRAPNLSIGIVTFESGVVARLTFSVVAPYDHRMNIMGDDGIISVEDCWNEGSPVRLERYSQLSLNARKSRTVRSSRLLRRIAGVGGVRLPMARKPGTFGLYPNGAKFQRTPRESLPQRIRRRELISIDYCEGVADVARSIAAGTQPSMPAEYCLHVNELVLAIQGAFGRDGHYSMRSTFRPIQAIGRGAVVTTESKHVRVVESWPVERLIQRLHRH